jgi:ribosomal 30S subunit maturation factor RimM
MHGQGRRRSIGQVKSVMKTGGAEILVVTEQSGQGTTDTAVDSIVVEVDPGGRRS